MITDIAVLSTKIFHGMSFVKYKGSLKSNETTHFTHYQRIPEVWAPFLFRSNALHMLYISCSTLPTSQTCAIGCVLIFA
jgi:hypothetical protein